MPVRTISKMQSEQMMRLAIREAGKNLASLDGGPFGAVIIRNGRVLAAARNTVLRDQDATCHAEINAIRRASRQMGSFDLSGCEIFSTTEPCPMCFSAIHWAKIDKVYFGTQISDVQKLGFNELSIPAMQMKKLGKSQVKLQKNFLHAACQELLAKWKALANPPGY